MRMQYSPQARFFFAFFADWPAISSLARTTSQALQLRRGLHRTALPFLALILLFLSPAYGQEGFFNFGFPQPTQLRWRLENPFRLFRSPADSLRHRRAYLALSKEDRETSPIYSAERLLQSEAGAAGWAKTVYTDTCFNGKTGRYTRCAHYLRPTSHRIVARLTNPSSFVTQCVWSVFNSLNRLLRRFEGACDREQKFDIPYPSGGRVEVRQGAALIAKQFIRVEDLLVVGLGDSVGSGEGNPDEPVRFDDRWNLSYGRVILAREGWFKWPRELTGYPRRAGKWEQIFDRRFNEAAAGWLDQGCHRSLYSYQARVALQLAVENEQRAVTFVSFACTGADTLNGVFLDSTVRECSSGKPAKLPSQLSALARELCRTNTEKVLLSAEVARDFPEVQDLPDDKKRILQCPGNNFVRKPDLLLVSLGGNDIGFSEMIADAILHRSSFYRKVAAQLDSVHGVERGAEKLASLPQRYTALARALSLYIGLPDGAQRNVLITSYPDMAYAEDGQTLCSGTEGMEVFPAFAVDGTRVANIEKLSNELYETLQAAAKTHGWTLVDSFRPAFRPRGFCARSSNNMSTVDGLSMPFHGEQGWKPLKPSLYRPYASRQRWIRTPNDAFMTVNYHQQAFGRTSCVSLGSLVDNPFQLFLAGTYGGAFHPTAEGQAAIADAVVKEAREMLKVKHVTAATH
jgi:hypothetical protein